MQMLSWEYESSDKTLSTLPLHAQYDHSNGKSMVHNTLALHAPDQLRQRMAWALSQVFVIAEDGLGKADQMEPWFAFYECATNQAPPRPDVTPAWRPPQAQSGSPLAHIGCSAAGVRGSLSLSLSLAASLSGTPLATCGMCSRRSPSPQ